jgi:hypothetical protein
MEQKLNLHSCESGIPFFGDGLSDTFFSWEADKSFATFSEEEDVGGSGGENVSGRVLDVDDIE